MNNRLRNRPRKVKNKTKQIQKSKEINDMVFLDLVHEQIVNAKAKLDKDTFDELRKFKEQTIMKVYELQKRVMTNNERYRLTKEFVHDELRKDELLKNKLENELLNKHVDKKIKQLVKKEAKEKILRRKTKGWLRYYWHWEMKEYKRIPLKVVPQIYVSKELQELFLLDIPGSMYKGKPEFILLRGIPFALPMEFRIEDLNEAFCEMSNIKPPLGNKGIKPELVFGRAGLSSLDLFNKYDSIKTKTVYKFKISKAKTGAFGILCFLMGCLITWSIVSPQIFTGGK